MAAFLLWAIHSPAWAQPPNPQGGFASDSENAPAPPEGGLAPETRAAAVPIEDAVRTVLGTTSRPVVFDWRRSSGLLQGEISQPVELNNFESRRLTAAVRWPLESGTATTSLSHVSTQGTEATETIARTPYLQTGRPSRWELGLGYDFAFAEGIVTMLPSFLPEAEMVFSISGEMRYLFYPGAWKENKGGQKFSSLFKTEINSTERAWLDSRKPAGMRIDPTRLDFLLGGRLDLFFKPGLFLSPSALIALPFLRAKGGLGLWWSLGVGVGYALPR